MANVCSYCGAFLSDESKFCTKCGTPIKSAPPVNPAPPVNFTPPVNPAPPVDPGNKNGNYVSSTGADGFVNGTESGSFSLRNGQLMNIISGEGFVKEDAVITNRRLYYSAKSGLINRNSKEQIVDIEDITGTTITTLNPYALLVWAGVFLLASIICFILAAVEDDSFILAGITGCVLVLFFSLSFFIFRKSFIKIEYAGGCIFFSVKKYGLKNVRAFQRRIYTEKEAIRQAREHSATMI